MNKIKLMALELGRAFGGLHYKALVMGHSGVGKSTELTRLSHDVENQYRVLRFSATKELDPISFQPFDVLLLMMAKVAEETAKPVDEGGAGKRPSDNRIQALWLWFADEKETIKRATELGVCLSSGAGVSGESWWAKALGLFTILKGELKFASVRQKETVLYRLSRLSELIDISNNLLDECNALLKESVGREWLIIGEDFDRAGIPTQQTEDLFVTYSNVLKSLRANLIFVIPIALGYSSKSSSFQVPQDRLLCLSDTPVFRRAHTPHKPGRDAVRGVLEARVAPELFARGQIDRLIVASGGNLRDLFALVSKASNLAVLRAGDKVQKSDVDSAVNSLRTNYEHGLGESPYDPVPVTYDQKAERLVRLYNGDPEAEVPDPVLYSLLRSRAVQEYNGECWFGLHPLVVDILVSHNRIQAPAKGAVPGGTR